MATTADGITAFRSDVNRGLTILTVGWTECALTSLFVIGRVYSRIQKRRVLGWDDWFILVAHICAVAFMAITTPEVHYGTGRHLEFLTDEQQAMSVKLDWVSQAFHITSTSVAKISIVLFIRQIIGNGQRTMVFLYGMVGTLCAVSALCIAFIFAQCTPTAALWDPRLAATAKCWSPKVQQDLGYFIASYAAFSDFVLAIFPVTILWKLQMELKLKLSLMVYMGLGAIASIASVIKTTQLSTLSARGDYTYETVDLIIWMMTEQFCIIIAACIPPMRSLFVTMYCNVIGQQSTGDRSTNRTGGTKPKRSYINQPCSNEDQDITRMNSSHCWRNGTGTSAIAYHGDPELASRNNTDVGAHCSDSDELLPGQHLIIMKMTEVRISETQK